MAANVTTGPHWPGVRYFTTWRTGGVSAAPYDSFNLGAHVLDDPDAVRRNRQQLRQWLPGEPVWIHQVHGVAVHEATRPIQNGDGNLPCADAMVTTRARLPLAILTADCLPVVLVNTDATVLGVVHAGWRGLLAGVLEETVALMRVREPQATDWRAWLGPCIGPASFEVGPEVREQFVAQSDKDARYFRARRDSDRWWADLPGLAERRLRQLGVGQVEQSGQCTYRQTERYFSYRRQPCTGRQATVAWLETRQP